MPCHAVPIALLYCIGLCCITATIEGCARAAWSSCHFFRSCCFSRSCHFFRSCSSFVPSCRRFCFFRSLDSSLSPHSLFRVLPLPRPWNSWRTRSFLPVWCRVLIPPRSIHRKDPGTTVRDQREAFRRPPRVRWRCRCCCQHHCHCHCHYHHCHQHHYIILVIWTATDSTTVKQ